MKYYSELLKKFYDTESECVDAEENYENSLIEKERKQKEYEEIRAKRAKEVENAYSLLVEARNNYDKKLSEFCKDYGSYYMSLNGLEANQFINHLVNRFI